MSVANSYNLVYNLIQMVQHPHTYRLVHNNCIQNYYTNSTLLLIKFFWKCNSFIWCVLECTMSPRESGCAQHVTEQLHVKRGKNIKLLVYCSHYGCSHFIYDSYSNGTTRVKCTTDSDNCYYTNSTLLLIYLIQLFRKRKNVQLQLN